jgi:heme/copper-type cytochrome/quinol oxidase subunit 2
MHLSSGLRLCFSFTPKALLILLVFLLYLLLSQKCMDLTMSENANLFICECAFHAVGVVAEIVIFVINIFFISIGVEVFVVGIVGRVRGRLQRLRFDGGRKVLGLKGLEVFLVFGQSRKGRLWKDTH